MRPLERISQCHHAAVAAAKVGTQVGQEVLPPKAGALGRSLAVAVGACVVPLFVLVASGASAAQDGGFYSGSPKNSDASLDARSDARSRDSGPIAPIPPDPTPLEDKRQWVVDLRWVKGEVFLTAVHKVELEAPRATPRVMGRFALELFEGPTLLERVRFDFPGLIDGDIVDAGHGGAPRIDKNLTTRIGVLFPRTARGTRFELWDRATDRRWPLGWPLAEGVRSGPPTDSRL